jgi:hypothetical protein
MYDNFVAQFKNYATYVARLIILMQNDGEKKK